MKRKRTTEPVASVEGVRFWHAASGPDFLDGCTLKVEAGEAVQVIIMRDVGCFGELVLTEPQARELADALSCAADDQEGVER